MSVKVMTHVWENSKQTGNALLVLLALADSANNMGECYPGVNRIAHYARISERSTQRILSKLVKDKELVIKYGEGAKTKNGSTNLYVIPVPETSRGVTPESPVGKTGVTVASPVGGGGVTPESPQGVTPESPKPSVEPSVKREPSVKDIAATSAAQEEKPLDENIVKQISEVVEIADKKQSSKKATKPKEAKPHSEQYKRLFNGVALVSYEIDFAKLGTRKIAPSTLKRIGLVAAWLDENSNTPEQLWQFAQWYKTEYPRAAMPCDLGKFQRHWLKWEGKGNTPIAPTVTGEPPKPVTVISEMIDAEAFIKREREKMRLAKEQQK